MHTRQPRAPLPTPGQQQDGVTNGTNNFPKLICTLGTPAPFHRAIVDHGLRNPMTCNYSSITIGDNAASSAAKE
ncbi:hypothetical protein [Brucella pseudogrignonensis]|jgi:hypothetical protein|uniref:Uncharacterized protein n=1 Tax=Brucella pseudogrignonensis TaxID=419475 RepID=A0A256G906_9HYPH|nr:hypothetical protein [Brucella pseudogrignonensis]MBO1026701.1 hypothetical protein [Ochrobactrum sp. SD129]NKX17208.1 hypothetical protein [Brucella pseudogrignonensis]OYR23605.1 hypothetical protein CEV34_3609 [Brucella pseudogrignonensis]